MLKEDASYEDSLKKVSLLEAFNWIRTSINNIKQSTISNCFEKFYKANPHTDMSSEAINDFDSDDREDLNPLTDLLDLEDMCYEPTIPPTYDEAAWLLKKLEGCIMDDASLVRDFFDLKQRVLRKFIRK